MIFEEIYTHQNFEIYLNGNPVWDYKISENKLMLIAFEIEDEEDTVTMDELADYIKEEGFLMSNVEVVNEETGQPIVDKKTGLTKMPPNPDWMLFEKCMRGDASDNVFSAYPGVRKKGTRNKVGLLEAFDDKNTKGYNWNNLMLQRWVDHNGEEHRVLDDYNRNVTLCDLTAQPVEVKELINNTISTVETKNITQVGMRLLKFCAKWDMQRIADQAAQYAQPLQARYENDKG